MRGTGVVHNSISPFTPTSYHHFCFTDLRAITIISILQRWKLRVRNTYLTFIVTTANPSTVFHSQMRKSSVQTFRNLSVITRLISRGAGRETTSFDTKV